MLGESEPTHLETTMNTRTGTNESEKFINRPWWFMSRGAMMFVCGSLVAIFSVTAPNVQMLGTSSSWLPIASFLVLLAGILRCVDAYASNSKPFLLVNMQGSMIDVVCGVVIFTSVGEKILAFILIIAAYLIMQGLFRVFFTFVMDVPNPKSARIGGGISVLLGLMVWMDWPFSGLWFLSFALSAEIAIRGWALMFYAHSVNKQSMASE